MKIQRNFFFILVLALAMSGCKIAPPQTLPKVVMPHSFLDDKADSASTADLPWNQLFTDQYLVTLIDTALYNNLDLLLAMQHIEMARNQFILRKGALKPRIDAQISAAGDHYGKYTTTGVGNFDTNLSGNIDSKQQVPLTVTPDYFVGVRSSWELDLWGKLKNQKQAAFADFLATQKGMLLTKTWLVAEVASRYYELVALDQELKIIRKNIVLQDSAFQIVQVQKLAGRVNELAVQQFEAQLLNTKALEGSVLSQTVSIENELNLLLGHFPSSIARDTAFFETVSSRKLNAGIPLQLLLRRPDIQQAKLHLEATTFDLKAAKAAFYPSITITPYLGLNAFKAALLTSGSSLAYGLLGSVTAPLIHNGALRSGEAIAVAARLESFYAYKKTILTAVSEVVDHLSQIKNLEDIYYLKAHEVEVLNAAVGTSSLLFKTGYASYLEVITAQRSVINAELELINTKKEMLLEVISLYQSLGGGWK